MKTSAPKGEIAKPPARRIKMAVVYVVDAPKPTMEIMLVTLLKTSIGCTQASLLDYRRNNGSSLMPERPVRLLTGKLTPFCHMCR